MRETTISSEKLGRKDLLHQKIDCAMGTDGEVYRCGQIREPSVTSGIGANYGNSMILYGTDPVVVEYDPNGHCDREILISSGVRRLFQGNQYSYIRPFSGETSFYNEKTGSYDPVDIRKQDFSREELADYIAADGKITVRYTAGSNAEIGVSQTLPLLMVTGRKADVEDTGTEKNSEILRLSPGLIWKWRRGGSMAFVGPNGAGKTTAIRIITGLLKADEGTVMIGGKDAFLYSGQVKMSSAMCRMNSDFTTT